MLDIIKRIEQEHDPDFDLTPGGPRVTWAERALAQAIRDLAAEVEALRAEVAELRPRHDRFVWKEGDLVKISDDDVVEISDDDVA